jgi:hypothetical protein
MLPVSVDTDLTLLPISVDLRQETDGPVTTKAHFDVWNEEEIKFSGAYRCITCWDQWLLSRHGIPNHFTRANLQTNKGKARIDGIASQLCDYDNDPKDQKALGDDINDIVSRPASLLGVAMKQLTFGGPGNVASDTTPVGVARAGTMLHGMGSEAGEIKVDVLGPPDEAQAPEHRVELLDPVNELLRAAGLSPIPPRSPRTATAPTAGGVSGVSGVDRVSATEKGSLLIFPKVELRWDADGNLIQDTFVDISNDYPQDVRIQMFFINGDPPLSAKRREKDGGVIVVD